MTAPETLIFTVLLVVAVLIPFWPRIFKRLYDLISGYRGDKK